MTDNEQRDELTNFLRTRRAQLSSTDVGLPRAARRKTAGLRREEVAHLAGVGVTWYTWLEQGRDIHVSVQVLESLAQTLRLSAEEKAHLFLLAGQGPPQHPVPQQEYVSPFLQKLLEQQGSSPAYITGRRWDVLAWNLAASQVIANFAALPVEERNIVRLIFTDKEFRSGPKNTLWFLNGTNDTNMWQNQKHWSHRVALKKGVKPVAGQCIRLREWIETLANHKEGCDLDLRVCCKV
jgi:transcriptional regulator with XRE-family HTH domain